MATPRRAVQEAAWRALNTPLAPDYSLVNELTWPFPP